MGGNAGFSTESAKELAAGPMISWSNGRSALRPPAAISEACEKRVCCVLTAHAGTAVIAFSGDPPQSTGKARPREVGAEGGSIEQAEVPAQG